MQKVYYLCTLEIKRRREGETGNVVGRGETGGGEEEELFLKEGKLDQSKDFKIGKDLSIYKREP